jgi:5'-AMP-activated protein kinase regulatory beta subunit
MVSPGESSEILSEISSGVATPANQVRTTFKWAHGGTAVFLIGSFNNWKERIRMEKTSEHTFTVVKMLHRDQTYEYKFIVDNEWRFAPDQPTRKDCHGNVNNFVNASDIPKKPVDIKRFRKYT